MITERFELVSYARDKLMRMEPNFGYNGYGEALFYRTYSLATASGMESWNDCVLRCVNGTFSIRKDWYAKSGIPWDEDQWQHYAWHFTKSMFNMEWLPPGRGLFKMGTEYVYQNGSMCLNNCGLTVIRNISKDIHWLMDALMNGVGVGFVPERDPYLKVILPQGSYSHVIPDSRLGWCDSVAALIDCHFTGSPYPRFDYSQIRPFGEPIKGFGGIASGPGPLIELHKAIRCYLLRYANDHNYCSVRLKTDIANHVGCCVVAGNVRRSAQLASGYMHDPVFMDLKNYDMYPERQSIGWMSNNSVYLEHDEDFLQLGEIAKRVVKNGEPGYINLRNLPKGRLGHDDNLEPDRAIGFNPCVTGNTKVLLANGRGYVPIQELAEANIDVPVYCVDEKDEIVIRKMRHPRKTGEKVPVVRVVLDDGSSMRVTPNHRFMLRDRSFKRADELDAGDQLAIVNRYTAVPSDDSYWNHYIQIGYGGITKMEHRLIAEYHHGDLSKKHVHHKDENKHNNDPDNLEVIDSFDHLSNHSVGEDNANYSGYSNKEMVNFGVQLCLKLGRKFSISEWEKEIGVSLNSDFRRAGLGTQLEFAENCADLAGVISNGLDPRTLRLFIEMQKSGYDPVIQDDKVFVHKECEHCKQTFLIIAQRREQGCCSNYCNNFLRDYALNREGQRKHFAAKRETTREAQLDIFTKLKFDLKREPQKSEWEAACKAEGVPFRLGADGSAFKNWYAVRYAAASHNHRVVEVYGDGVEDVYNGTVDDYHNFIIGGWEDSLRSGTRVERGVINPQCGEIELESAELCNLAESMPLRCADVVQWHKALEYATFYATTVALLPTHRPETNAVMLRNRRIGVSLCNVTGFIQKYGMHIVTSALRKGYKIVRTTNNWLSDEAGVPRAIRVTTVKPGGTVPRLAGQVPGQSRPTYKETLRRFGVGAGNPIAELLAEAGLPYEVDIFDSSNLKFEYPILQDSSKTIAHTSLWEQAFLLVTLQREWADNAVSNTLYFKPKWKLIQVDVNPNLDLDKDQKIETDQWGRVNLYQFDPTHEEDEVEPVLASIAPHTKSVSLMPYTDGGVYPQSPETYLSPEEYKERVDKLPKINWKRMKSFHQIESDNYCAGPSCEIPGR